MKKTALILIIILSFIVPVYWLLYSSQVYRFYPSDEPIGIGSFADGDLHETDTGYSKIISALKGDDAILFRSVIGHRAKFPYSGMGIFLEDTLIDLSSYDFGTIVTDSQTKGYNLTLTEHIKEYSVDTMRQTHRYLQMDHNCTGAVDTFTFAIKELPIPAWWYSMNKVKRDSFTDPDYSRISAIVIGNHPATKDRDTVSVTITSIVFFRSQKGPLLLLLFLLVLWPALISLARYIKGRGRVIPIAMQQFESMSKKDSVLLVIGEHYANAALTIESVSEFSGESPYQIRTILKEEFGKSFSDYLKWIRLEEASRILRESELGIKEIAYRIGFSHPSSFTRAFKENFQITPSEYRQQNKKGDS